MRFVDEYRDRLTAERYARLIRHAVTHPWSIMEVCGGQTHSIVKYGVDELLPAGVTLLHGPGCPVCVTATEVIDQAIALAERDGVILCSFGDMLRVPGTERDLLAVKAAGGDVRMVYSPLDALKLAREHPERQVVFFAVGFETTAPTVAMAVRQAALMHIDNFSLLCAHVRVPPALEVILEAPGTRVQGFLAAGHVCTVMGQEEYEAVTDHYRVPIVITGFEPVDLLHGILLCVQQLERGRGEVENQYRRCVRTNGNRLAQTMMGEVFCTVTRRWRGLGEIPDSGLALRPEYARFDAIGRFGIESEKVAGVSASPCISGLILQGLKKPHECPAFGTGCTPEQPLGATMVSAEGTCNAYYRYRHTSLSTTVRESGSRHE